MGKDEITREQRKLNINEVQNSTGVNAAGGASRLKYNLGNYVANRSVRPDSFSLSGTGNAKHKNALESVYEKLLLKCNPGALLDKYMTDDSVNKMLNKNPLVGRILQEQGVNAVVCTNNLKDIKDSHINTTMKFAVGTAEQMSLSSSDKDTVAMGSLFHDFGKIMIPAELLNKNGKLTSEERQIVNTHSVLGYEMLKTTGMDSKVLAIVRNHHCAAAMTNDIRSKIVSAADVYSALTEVRAYKDKLPADTAFRIMGKFVEENRLDYDVVHYLKRYIETGDNSAAA